MWFSYLPEIFAHVIFQKKLDNKSHGLFRILKCIEMQAYQLDLPDALKNIYDVFHVSLLEPYPTVKEREPDPPLFIDIDNENLAEIEGIVGSKMYYKKLTYLVKWLGYPVTDNE